MLSFVNRPSSKGIRVGHNRIRLLIQQRKIGFSFSEVIIYADSRDVIMEDTIFNVRETF